MNWGDSTRVWDLTDGTAVARRALRRRDVGGTLAAALGAAALACTALPGIGTDVRWSMVLLTGCAAALVAVSAIRRRRTLASMLLVVFGLVSPLAAGASMVWITASDFPLISSRTVAEVTLMPKLDGLDPSYEFATLPDADQADAERLATALVLRMRSLHGSSGPYPTRLALSQGSIVEAGGPLRGTALAATPSGSRVVYEVTPSRTAFRVTISSVAHPGAAVTAESGLIVPGVD